MKNRDMIVEMMSLLKLVFDPEICSDKETNEKLLEKREVRRLAMTELKRDYEHYKKHDGIFKKLV